MSKFQDLPNELILKILSYSEIKALITCGQVSKRIRTISGDDSLWATVYPENKIMKTELLEMILGKGCMALKISNCTILGSLSSNIKSQLRILDLSESTLTWPVSITLLFPISKIHSKQNFRKRPDHCDWTPCIAHHLEQLE